MAKQDTHQRAKERYADAKEALREQHVRMLEDLRFSNPAKPEQWPDDAKTARKNRPCLTFDRTNQFIQQVVNQARQNKPSIKFLPASNDAQSVVADKLNGMMRHIEYVSRAGVAYDTAVDHIARCGLGWLRVIPEIIRPDTNEQEIRIMRVHDPLAAVLCDSTEPDGSDASGAFVETLMSVKAFEAKWPKAKPISSDGDMWATEDGIKIAEYFEVVETPQNKLVVQVEGRQATISEEEYWDVHKTTGVRLPVVQQFEQKARSIKWIKMTGAEILEETDFPSQFLPVIPVIGDEIWIDGKRYLCGMVRKMMDSQRFHNYTTSQAAETIALQPKAPYIGAIDAIEGFEDKWERANHDTAAILPFNHKDDLGNPIPPPQRSQPPVMGPGWADLMQYSIQALQASIGNFEANLGEKGNAVSGRAKLADQHRGDTANFHYVDNLSRSMEQLGRVVCDMIPRIYDTQRQARIVGEDGTHSFMQIDPGMDQAVARDQQGNVTAINPGIGAYDVRVEVGPSYTSQRQEAAQNIVDMSQGNPQLGAALAPMLMKMRDMPEGERAYKVALALLPPQVQQAYEDESQGQSLPPQVTAKMQQMQQMLQQAGQELQQLHGQLQQMEQQAQQQAKLKQMDLQSRERIEAARLASAERLAVMNAKEAYERTELQGMTTLLSKQVAPPPDLSADVSEDIAEDDS